MPVKPRSDVIKNSDGKVTTRVIMVIPLFFPDDDLLAIQGTFNLKKQIKKRLEPIKLLFGFDSRTNKIKIINESAADKLSIRLAVAIGHVHKKQNLALLKLKN